MKKYTTFSVEPDAHKTFVSLCEESGLSLLAGFSIMVNYFAQQKIKLGEVDKNFITENIPNLFAALSDDLKKSTHKITAFIKQGEKDYHKLNTHRLHLLLDMMNGLMKKLDVRVYDNLEKVSTKFESLEKSIPEYNNKNKVENLEEKKELEQMKINLEMLELSFKRLFKETAEYVEAHEKRNEEYYQVTGAYHLPMFEILEELHSEQGAFLPHIKPPKEK